MSESQNKKEHGGFINAVKDAAENFEICGIPGNTIKNFNLGGVKGLTPEKAVQNFSETGSAMVSKEDLDPKKK